jgi:hypothetical protein
VATLANLAAKRKVPTGRLGGVASVWNPAKKAVAPKIPTGHLGGVASVWNPQVKSALIPQGPAQVAPALQSLVQPPAAAPAAAPQSAPNGDISTVGDVDPRDATYGAGLAALLGQVQSQRQAVRAASDTDQQGFNENLGRIASNRSSSLDANQTNANRQGLFYSGILGKRQGDTNAQYDDQINQNRTALTGREAQRQAQLQQIGNLTADAGSPYGYTATGGAGLDFYNLLRDAADRRAAAAAAAAPDMSQADATPAASMAAPGATPPANHTGPTAKLPVYHATTPTAKPKKVAKPAPIHGTGKTVTLTRKK